jgi:hypothetical protein
MWEHEYEVHSTQNIWVVLSAIPVVGLLTVQRQFSGNCSTTAAWRCALAVSWRFWFCNGGAPALHGEDEIYRKVDWTWRVHCMASLVVGSNSARFFFFLRGHVKHMLNLPFLATRTLAALTLVIADVLTPVWLAFSAGCTLQRLVT